MSKKKPESVDLLDDIAGVDLSDATEEIVVRIPKGVDRRTFLIRSAMLGAMSVMTGSPITAQEKEQKAAAASPAQAAEPQTAPQVPLSPDLEVVKQQKGPVMTVIDEFYKVGPGPSRSR